ncbi:MAG: sigma-54 dependent transcriptional regulator [Thermoanaerobaculales bacterium]|jgi:DNA-binding NtrC family response regulator|nr:sigma-54 dependent transcriptional regulator [Thermoanaerobaculales bacterium]
MGQRILVVDDDPAMCEMMALALSKEGYEVQRAGTVSEAITVIREQDIDLVVADIYLGDGTGLDLVDAVEIRSSNPRFILVTARGSVETAAVAHDHGVFDYLAKPFKIERLVDRVSAALGPSVPAPSPPDDGPRSMIVGSDPSIVEVYKAVARVAPLPIPVLIRGETGTGKELVATALHRFGSNPQGPFVPINCGAIPENLLESELFGHRRGSFTGAHTDHPGAVEAARDGTLFLDEVGELPAALQVKLLRFLQSGEIQAVGSKQRVEVPVRVVAATHRDLRAEASAGLFREDVYYRIAAYEIELPPLRDRPSDIPMLVEHFRRRHGGAEASPAGEEVLRLLARHPWPGNVRQLEHVVQRTIIDSGGLTDDEVVGQILESLSDRNDPVEDTLKAGDEVTLKDLEARHIEGVLRRCSGNRTLAARILGIERKTLYRKAKRLGIRLDPEEAP